MRECVTLEHTSDEWFAARLGLPSASQFSKICKVDGKASSQRSDYAAQLAAEKYAEEPLEGMESTWQMQRGSELEEEAAAWYRITTGSAFLRHQFITSDEWAGFGMAAYCASPDCLLQDGLVPVEIKCGTAAQHTQDLAYLKRNGRPPAKFVMQLQGQIMACGAESAVLLLYHPRLPKQWFEVQRDDELCSALSAGINAVAEMRDELYETLKEYE